MPKLEKFLKKAKPATEESELAASKLAAQLASKHIWLHRITRKFDRPHKEVLKEEQGSFAFIHSNFGSNFLIHFNLFSF